MKMYKSCLLYLLNQRNPTPFGPSYASFYTPSFAPNCQQKQKVLRAGGGMQEQNTKLFFGGGERRKVGVATFESSNLLVFTKGYDLSHHAK